jgi:hypothetical protein
VSPLGLYGFRRSGLGLEFVVVLLIMGLHRLEFSLGYFSDRVRTEPQVAWEFPWEYGTDAGRLARRSKRTDAQAARVGAAGSSVVVLPNPVGGCGGTTRQCYAGRSRRSTCWCALPSDARGSGAAADGCTLLLTTIDTGALPQINPPPKLLFHVSF